MKTLFIAVIALFTSAISTISSAMPIADQAETTPQILWQVQGFNMPESVVYDEKRKRYYVSNVHENPLLQDHNGSIGWIGEDGLTSELEWITGLSSPKGLLLDGEYLYAADVKELVVMNVDTGLITARYEVPNSGVLNGIAISKAGQVFVSDWSGNAIYVLTDNQLSIWLEENDLESPNGLFIKNGYIYVGAWGTGVQSDFTTLTSGSLKRISIRHKTIETLSDGERWMNLDGIHPLKRRQWLATDFIRGRLLKLNSTGDIIQEWLLEPSAADFYFNAQTGLLVVPYLMGQKVVAYSLYH